MNLAAPLHLLASNTATMGNSRKYPYPTTGGMNILTLSPLGFGNSKMLFLLQPSGIPCLTPYEFQRKRFNAYEMVLLIIFSQLSAFVTKCLATVGGSFKDFLLFSHIFASRF